MDFSTTFFSCWTCLHICCSFYFSFHSWYKMCLQNQSWFLHDRMFFKIVLLLRICFWTRLLCLLTVWVCPFYFCIFYVYLSFYWMTFSSLNPRLISFTSNPSFSFLCLEGDGTHHPNWFSFLILCPLFPICHPLISCTWTSFFHFVFKFLALHLNLNAPNLLLQFGSPIVLSPDDSLSMQPQSQTCSDSKI